MRCYIKCTNVVKKHNAVIFNKCVMKNLLIIEESYSIEHDPWYKRSFSSYIFKICINAFAYSVLAVPQIFLYFFIFIHQQQFNFSIIL